MGGRMASMMLAEDSTLEVICAVYLGYPLHPPGGPERQRTEHLPAVSVPQLFVSGTRDRLARRDLLESAVRRLDGARLQLIKGADHSLSVDRKAPLEGAEEWLDVVADFVQSCAGGRSS